MPFWLTTLSGQLPVIGLVGHYPTNYHDRPQARLYPKSYLLYSGKPEIIEYYLTFRLAILEIEVDSYVLLSRPPLPCQKTGTLDLHISGTPPTFILSQDQTLKKNPNPLNKPNFKVLLYNSTNKYQKSQETIKVRYIGDSFCLSKNL